MGVGCSNEALSCRSVRQFRRQLPNSPSAKDARGYNQLATELFSCNDDYAPPLPLPHATGEKRFEPGDPAALDHLEEHGYVVVKEVLDPQEVEHAVSLFWQWLAEFSAGRIRRDSPQTWGGSAWPCNPANGVCAAGGLGQSHFMWHIRLQPRVLEAFAGIWKLDNVEDLLMSFDGACAFRPPEIDASWRTRGNWFHVDQNGQTTGSDRVCVQGFVTLMDSTPDTGGLVVLPGSHRHHAELFQRWEQRAKGREGDFFVVPRPDPLLEGDTAIHPRLVCAKAGDLVLWDSRCIHCNVPAPHLLDSKRLDHALADADLPGAVAPLCSGLSSVADAVWLFHQLSRSDASGDIRTHLLKWGVPQHELQLLLHQFRIWAVQLEEETLSSEECSSCCKWLQLIDLDEACHEDVEEDSGPPMSRVPSFAYPSPGVHLKKNSGDDEDSLVEDEQSTPPLMSRMHSFAPGSPERHKQYVQTPRIPETPHFAPFRPSKRSGAQPAKAPADSTSSRGHDLQRLVAYVCAVPRQTASYRMRRLRQQGLWLGATTTHWPNRLEIREGAPGAAGSVKPYQMSPLALRLAGCDGSSFEAMHEELTEAQADLYGANVLLALSQRDVASL
mmetsp:Transcript_58271/g.103564  ORF Transcript_58271/g.103564 Transcript_58271/m.103564 type:complete len:612 (-) Transcript_58271:115-1950(-)